MKNLNENFKIAEEVYHQLLTVVDKLNRKATKLGLQPITIKEIGTEFKTVDEKTGEKIKIINIQVNGSSPKIDGWELIGVLHHVAGKTIQLDVPGKVIPKQYIDTSAFECDQCHKAIARNETFIIFNKEKKQYAKVGRTCLKDFLGGHQDIKMLMEFYQSLEKISTLLAKGWDEEEGMNRGGNGYRYEDLDRYLYYVITSIKIDGWVSRKEEHEGYNKVSTATLAYNYLHPTSLSDPPPTITDEVIAEVKSMVISLKEYFVKGTPTNNYEQNIKTIIELGIFDSKTIGIAASIPNFCYKLNKERQEKQLNKSSQWVGEIKQKIQIKLKLLGKNYADSLYGVMVIYRFVDQEDNRLVWFSSTDIEMKEEEFCLIKATVKEHSEYKGHKQTIITRCKIVE